MGRYKGAVITTVGQNLIAEALAGHGTVTFTTLVTSSHQYPDVTNLQALTSLDDVEQTVIISSATVFDSNILQVAANVGNAGVTTAYLIHTIGLYAKLDDNTPVLAAVIVAINPDEMPAEDPASPSSFLYTIQMLISNADQINVTVNPAASVTVAELDLAMSYKYDKDNVAAIEPTGVASRAYAVGEYILYNGKTYRVTVGIPSGTALTPGTNVLEVRLGEEINRKIDNTSVANNLATTQSGYVLDARQGKVLKDAVDEKYDKSNVAYIQTSNIAARAYAIGDYLLFNSRTYRVTAAIASGAAIVPGTNVTEVKIGDELKLKFDKANVVNNLTTTVEGFALDARQGKALVDLIDDKFSAAWTWDGRDDVIAANTPYTTPADGYVVIFYPAGSTGAVYAFVTVGGIAGLYCAPISGHNTYSSIYVKKGMNVVFQPQDSVAQCKFRGVKMV